MLVGLCSGNVLAVEGETGRTLHGCAAAKGTVGTTYVVAPPDAGVVAAADSATSMGARAYRRLTIDGKKIENALSGAVLGYARERSAA